ncbi:hypothetical protein PS943_01473 [Pseudomonas fluorescens]|uniref:NinG protein n=1 Tax=Pseudomonas fluorescens TaxID=294 RepID=A0A5E7W4G6_PSEFL|nr:recombination protein NinG [Pseudomonas fluorescens]VVQ29744.1 hypothetical protein PS943_01473 [Pseudomonas fluorescens]
MRIAPKPSRPKKCKNPACGISFPPQRLGQAVCSPKCGLAIKDMNQEKARKSLAQIERKEIKVRKEKLKSRADHLKDTQQAFNAWVRERDAELPCISCGRHHQGKYDAGHYRTVGSKVNGHSEFQCHSVELNWSIGCEREGRMHYQFSRLSRDFVRGSEGS